MITALPQSSVNQIKSGQVIVELSSTLKELVENSIDAGATSITVKVFNHGLDGISVSDNGTGIHESDFDMVARPHATSKLSNFEGLTQLQTLGFRGEALGSICQVAKLSIATCYQSEPLGFNLEFAPDGSVSSKTAAALPKGTTVNIKDIFRTLPVRRKDLERNSKRKYTDAIRVLQSYALIWSGNLVVEHVLSDSKRSTVLRAQGAKLLDRISLIFGAKTASNLLEIDVNGPTLALKGRITQPMALMKGQRSNIRLVYINGRPVENKQIEKTVVSLVQEYEPHASPFFVLDLQLDPSQLDINLSPDKRDVRLLHSYKILEELRQLLHPVLDNEEQSLHRTSTQREPRPASPALTSLSRFIGQGPIKGQMNKPREHSDSDDDDSEDETPRKVARTAAVATPTRHTPRQNAPMPETPDSVVGATTPAPSRGSSRGLAVFTYGTDFLTGSEYESSEHGSRGREYVYESPTRGSSRGKERLGSAETDERHNTHILIEQQDVTDDDEEEEDDEAEDGSEDQIAKKPVSTLHEDFGCDGTTVAEVDISKTAAQIIDVDGCESIASEVVPDGALADPDCSTDPDVSILPDPLAGLTDPQGLEGSLDSEPEALTSSVLPSGDTLDSQCSVSVGSSHPPTSSGSADTQFQFMSSSASHKTLNVHISTPVTIADVEAAMAHLPRPRPASIRSFAPDEDTAADRLNLIIRKNDFAQMKIIGQFNLGFILVSKEVKGEEQLNKKDIFIIDQHASDEIFNFERLQRTTVMRRQPLVVKRQLELSAVEELTLINNLAVFERNGFSIQVDPEGTPGKQCFITALPFSKGTVFNEADVNELIYKIADNPSDSSNLKCSKLRSMFAMRACRSSIMVGHSLKQNTMRRVVDNLGTLNKPWNCPHGRPTLRHITTLV